MRVVACSDMHGQLPKVPECDLLIIAGDSCPVWNHRISFQEEWLKTEFSDWLRSIPAKHIVGIAGNHDMVMDKQYLEEHRLEFKDVARELPWTYLFDEMVEIEGLKIYGTPYQKMFNEWPFMKYEHELEILWADMPKCDIVVVHGPPFGAGDIVKFRGYQGSPTLANKLEELEIPWCICGHIHENYGIHRLGKTKVVNAAILDDQYIVRHEPMRLEIVPSV